MVSITKIYSKIEGIIRELKKAKEPVEKLPYELHYRRIVEALIKHTERDIK